MNLLGERRFANSLRLSAVFLLVFFVMNKNVNAAVGEKANAPELRASIPLEANLTALKGKTITVFISSGQSETGVVKEVQDNLLHLEKLSQKEFYDALIRVDQIMGIEVRVR